MTSRSLLLVAVASFAVSALTIAEPPDSWFERDIGSDGIFVRWSEPTDGESYRLVSSETMQDDEWDLLPLTAEAGPDGGQQQLLPSPDEDEDAPARRFYRLQQENPDPDVELHVFVPGTQRVQFSLPVNQEEPEGEQRRRELYVFIPDSYSPPACLAGGAWPCPGGHPLAIVLHGSGQTAQGFQDRHPDLISTCNAEGMILLIPQGEINPVSLNYGWNSAEQPGQRDDLRFLVQLRELALRLLYVDPNQVHVGGFSNGGVMSMLASHSLPRLFASGAAVGSNVRSENLAMGVVSEVPETMAPHPVMLVNARNDTKRPFTGGVVGGVLHASYGDGQSFLSAEHCGHTNPVTTTSDFQDGSLAFTRDVWCGMSHQQDCARSFEVNTVALQRGGPNWTDANDGAGFDANEEVVDFFKRHRVRPVEDYGDFVGVPETAGGTRGPLPGWNIPVAFDIPSIPGTIRGLVVFCHGPGIDHEAFMDFSEMTAFAGDVYAEDLGWVAYSADHSSQLWDLQNGPAGNEDILNLLRILERFAVLGYINSDTPIIPIGFDRGAHFALLTAHLLHSMGFPVGGCGLLNPDWSQPLPAAAAQAKADTLVPAWSFTQENDAVAHPAAVWNYHQILRYRHPALREYSVMDIGREKCPDADRFSRILPPVDGDLVYDYLVEQNLFNIDGKRIPCRRELGGALASLSPPDFGYSTDQLAEIFAQLQVMFATHHPEAAGDTRFFEYLDGMIGGDDGLPVPPWIVDRPSPGQPVNRPPLGDPVG